MKVNLITIFPGIVLETLKWDWGKEIEDPDALEQKHFISATIVSFSRAISTAGLLDKQQLKNLQDVHEKIVDADGNHLTNYTIILERGVENRNLEVPNTDSQQLLTYFSYVRGIDHWVTLDHLKIMSFDHGGRELFVNNMRLLWRPQYLYLLPINHQSKGKVRLHRQREEVSMDVLAKLYYKNNLRYKRILNSMSLFNGSCGINPLNPNASIVLMVSAFESLFDLPRSSKDIFAYAIKSVWGFDERIESWARELYELRSQIVHGDVIEGEKLMASKDRHYPQFRIARQIFDDSLHFVLEGMGLISLDRKYRIETIKKLRNTVISNKEKVVNIVRRKKDFSYKAFLNNRDLYRDFVLAVESLTMTDYSARDSIPQLLSVLHKITKSWIEEERKKKYNLPELKEYLDFREERFVNILKLFEDVHRYKGSLDTNFELRDIIEKVEEEVSQLNPVVRDTDKFDFTIDEFLDRCLRALFATF